MFVKGVCANPKGRPKGSKSVLSVCSLRDALKVVEKEKKKRILVHAWERAYENDAVLIALLRKFIPDAETIEEQEEKLIDQTFIFENEPKRVNGRFNRFYN